MSNVMKQMGIFLCLILVVLLACGCSTKDIHSSKKEQSFLEEGNWSEDVKTALDDFIYRFGNQSDEYQDNAYVVFDFDNSTSINNVENALSFYQLQKMAFVISPEDLGDVLRTNLGDCDRDLREGKYGVHSYNDWISDICVAYSYLYEKYGPFKASGIEKDIENEVRTDPYWREFATKMYVLRNVVSKNETIDVSLSWQIFWFTGMTKEELYKIAIQGHKENMKLDSNVIVWGSPDDIDSKVGSVELSWECGIQITDEMKNLWSVLNENGIDVWVCSGSNTEIIEAAIDAAGLHDLCKGVLGINLKTKKGTLLNQTNRENAHPMLAAEDGIWIADKKYTIHDETYGIGKVNAINDSLVKKYGTGPLAGFMDSTGDYNFCTEYKSLKVVVCFNVGTRRATNGGGIIGVVSRYQKKIQNYDLEKALNHDDTLYVLQGIDYRGKRTFNPSSGTVLLNGSNGVIFAHKDTRDLYRYASENIRTSGDIINTFCIKTRKNDTNNPIGHEYGFLKKYNGYHSR